MDESQNSYDECEKPDQKRVHSILFHLCKLQKNKNKFVKTESRSFIAWTAGGYGKEGGRDCLQRGTRKLFRVLDTFIILIVVIFHKCVHMPKFTKFYTLNICGLFMSVYLSKFVFQKHTHTKGEPKGTQGSRRVQMEGSVS